MTTSEISVGSGSGHREALQRCWIGVRGRQWRPRPERAAAPRTTNVALPAGGAPKRDTSLVGWGDGAGLRAAGATCGGAAAAAPPRCWFVARARSCSMASRCMRPTGQRGGKGGRSEDAPRVTKDVPRHKARNVGGASAQSASESVTGWTPSSIAGGVGGRGASGGHVKHAIRPGCVMASGEARGWVAPPQTWLAKRGGVSRRGPHRQPGPTVEALAPPPPSWWSKLSFVVGCPPHRLSPTTTFFGGKRSAVSAARDPWTRSRGGRLKFHRLGCTRVHACAPIASEASSTMLRGRQTA